MNIGLASIQGIILENYESTVMPGRDGDLGKRCYVEHAIILSKMVLDSSLSVECKGCKKQKNIVELLVRFEGGDAPTGYLFVEAEYIHEDKNGGVSNFELVAQVCLILPETERVKCFEYLAHGLQILIKDLPEKITLESGETAKIIPINWPKFNYLVGRPHYPNWYEDALATNARALIGNLSISRLGQTAVIVGEFVGSAAASHLLLEAGDKKIKTAIELICDLRVATRISKNAPSTDDNYSNLWDHSPHDFQQAVSSLEEVERKKLTDQYDRLWGTFNLTSAIQFGEDEYGALASGFEPNADELISVARRLVALAPMRSDELERILISALIYAETIAFARTILSKEKLMGMSIPMEKLMGVSIPWSLIKAVWATAKNIALDGIKIALTFALAFVVSNENHTAAWIVTAGYTLFRWWREVALILGKKGLSGIDLLLEMAMFHKYVDDQSSNSRYLRERLYKITDEGAVFSPWVFTLIDRQINSVDDRSQHTKK